jgi:hypothetical protein
VGRAPPDLLPSSRVALKRELSGTFAGRDLPEAVNAEVSPGQAGWTIVPVEPPMLLEDCQSRVMQNGLYVAVSAQAPLPPRLQAIGDNVANMNVVGRVVTGASFETEMTRAGEARLRRSDPRQSGQIAPRIYVAMNQSIEAP